MGHVTGFCTLVNSQNESRTLGSRFVYVDNPTELKDDDDE